MRQGFIVFLSVCVFAAAMVPRERRAVNTEEEEENLRTQTTTTAASETLCDPETPCAWSVYNSAVKYIEMNITNTYCICGKGTHCLINENDSTNNAYVHRCRPLVEEDTTVES